MPDSWLQIHYNNQDMTAFTDPGSGVRLYFSDELRPYDAGTAMHDAIIA
jgi:hypothetical protein